MPNLVNASTYVQDIPALAALIHLTNVEHQFYDREPGAAEQIALCHSELSEALEGYRQPTMPMSDKIPAFTVAEEEMADTLIRVLDFCHFRKMNLTGAIVAKMHYNNGRPIKHGGKKF